MILWAESPALASWPYIAASSVVHYGYYYFLALAYKWGDLSRVYPISRGIAPLLVSVGALIFVGEQLSVLGRSEEHTSELQSLMRISYAVFCLKKKKRNKQKSHHQNM